MSEHLTTAINQQYIPGDTPAMIAPCDQDCGCMEPPELRWFIVETAPWQEIPVFRALSKFKPYLPLEVARRRKMRSGRPVLDRGTPVIEEILRPFFPGYLFVPLDLANSSWGVILRTPGVKRILASAGDSRPRSIAAECVEWLMGQGRAGDGAIDLDPPRVAFPRGTAVRVLDGRFAGFDAVIENDDRNARVLVLLEIFGRITQVDLPRGSIKAKA